jgi:hypothetical protein
MTSEIRAAVALLAKYGANDPSLDDYEAIKAMCLLAHAYIAEHREQLECNYEHSGLLCMECGWVNPKPNDVTV